jgi:hypothetical protein
MSIQEESRPRPGALDHAHRAAVGIHPDLVETKSRHLGCHPPDDGRLFSAQAPLVDEVLSEGDQALELCG